MGIEAIFLLIALAIVPLTRGSYRQLAKLKLNHTWTLAIVLIGYAIMEFAPIPKSRYDDLGFIILLATYVYLLSFCIVNIKVRAMWIALIGLASNALVISLNRGMPVTTTGGYIVNETIRHQASTPNDVLGFLGDIIPINAINIAISIGDIIFGIGIVAIVYFASRKPNTAELQAQIANEEFMAQAAALQIDLTKEDVTDEQDIVVDLNEKPQPALAPEMQQKPYMKKRDDKQQKKLKKRENSRAHKRWQKSHGLASLPAKEELGFDDSSMTVVDAAQD